MPAGVAGSTKTQRRRLPDSLVSVSAPAALSARVHSTPDEYVAALLCRALAVECVGAMSCHISDSGVTGEQLTATCKLLDGSAGEEPGVHAQALLLLLWSWCHARGRAHRQAGPSILALLVSIQSIISQCCESTLLLSPASCPALPSPPLAPLSPL